MTFVLRMDCQEQGCWVHRTANVLDKLPKRLQPRAKKHLHEIFQAETKEVAQEQVEAFQREYGDRYPKAVASLLRDEETLFRTPSSSWLTVRPSRNFVPFRSSCTRCGLRILRHRFCAMARS